MRKTIIVLTAAVASFGSGVIAGTASASIVAPSASGDVTAVTHAADHPDTTNVSGPATLTSTGGPVWAFDDLAVRFTVTPGSTGSDGGNYSVTITDNGSFSAFADPTTGDAITASGSVRGTIQYDVFSSTPPDPANLPAQEPGDSTRDQAGMGSAVHTVAMLNQLFGGNAVIVGGGAYTFTYKAGGGTYVQDTNGISGDIG
jgi:hypothetical protein